jgi:hypothetical protein
MLINIFLHSLLGVWMTEKYISAIRVLFTRRESNRIIVNSKYALEYRSSTAPLGTQKFSL